MNSSPALTRTGLILMLVVQMLARPGYAMMPYPGTFTDQQPDGTTVQLYLRGHAQQHWYEDTAGYPALRNADTGSYVYARQDAAGQLTATAYAVGAVTPAAVGIRPLVAPSSADTGRLHDSTTPVAAGYASAPVAANVATTGVLKNLVVMIRFADHVGRTLPTPAEIDTLMNAVGGDPLLAPTGSVRDVLAENSYGALELQSTVLAWVTVSHDEAYYNNSTDNSKVWEALVEALTIVDASVDFSQFDTDSDGRIDAITVLHSGYAAEFGGTDPDGAGVNARIFTHKDTMSLPWISAEGVAVQNYHINPALWSNSGSDITRIGVISHETLHFLGLPDLYDQDFSSAGLGNYELMANPWGFDGSQYYPPHLSAWSKIQLGWLTPVEITDEDVFPLPAVETTPTVYRLSLGYNSNEYLLIENRQPIGFDAQLPQGGIAIWHIDEIKANNDSEGYPGQPGWPQNGNHYKVALLQADGQFDLESNPLNLGDSGDLFHADGVDHIGPDTTPDTNGYHNGVVTIPGHTLSNISAASANMSFTYSLNPPPPSYYLRNEAELAAWIDTTSGTSHNLGNDDSTLQAIGFNFDFYGNPAAEIFIAANGTLSFAPFNLGANSPLPDNTISSGLIAPFWDDLAPNAGGTVTSLTDGYAPRRRFTVTWQDIPASPASGGASFQATLYEQSGDIVFRYQDVIFNDFGHDAGISATIGIQDASGSEATQHAFNAEFAVSNGSALRFSQRKDLLLVNGDPETGVLADYTAALAEAGWLYDTRIAGVQGDGPDAATLAGYRAVLWFTGATSGAFTGPSASAETALASYLDGGGCVLINSQDYYDARGLTPFMQSYLGITGVTANVTHGNVSGVTPLTSIGSEVVAPGFSNRSDSLTGSAVLAALNGDQGTAGLAHLTPNYRTQFWTVPFSGIGGPFTRTALMNDMLRYCQGNEIDSDGDGLHLDTELRLGSNPLRRDSDGDGLDDLSEVLADGDPYSYTPGIDLDPNNYDTDGDGRHDGIDAMPLVAVPFAPVPLPLWSIAMAMLLLLAVRHRQRG